MLSLWGRQDAPDRMKVRLVSIFTDYSTRPSKLHAMLDKNDWLWDEKNMVAILHKVMKTIFTEIKTKKERIFPSLVWGRTICRISLDNSGIVRTTGAAFVVQPMKLRSPFSFTVITKNILDKECNRI